MNLKQWITALAKGNLDPIPDQPIPQNPGEEIYLDTLRPPRSGMVWVDSNGHIIVKNPDPGEPYAVIYLDPDRHDMELLVNGKPSSGSIVVQESDHIIARPESPASKSRVAIDVDGPGMVATLTATFERGMVRQLRETPPLHFLELLTDNFLRAPVPIVVEHVRDEMDRQKIRYGRVALEVIEEFLAQRKTGAIPIAHGTPAVAAVADTYLPTARHRVEYYPGTEISHPDLVSAGTVVASRVTGSPSRVGMTVFGTPIAPPQAAPSTFRFGNGIVVTSTGQHLVAKSSGRVIWDDKGVTLIPLKAVAGALTRDHEILHEEGDLVVQGSVVQTVLIAYGNVVITGDVSHSRIIAGGSIFINGTTDYATVECGVDQPFAMELRRKIEEIGDAIGTLTQMMDQIHQEAPEAYRSQFPNLLEKLFRQKCGFVPTTVLWLSQNQWLWKNNERTLSDLASLIEHISQCFKPESWQSMQNLNELEALNNEIEQWLVLAAPSQNLLGLCENAVLHNVYRSLIRSQGTIQVADAVTSEMEAGTQIQARTLVGGFYQAQAAIIAQFIGSEDSTETSVQVYEALGKVTADILFPNTVIQIGEQRHRVNRVAKNAVVDSF